MLCIDTAAIVRTDYVHETQERINTASNADKRKLEKLETKFKDQLLELKTYEEKIHHYADMMIPLDFDDGVKVNYD